MTMLPSEPAANGNVEASRMQSAYGFAVTSVAMTSPYAALKKPGPQPISTTRPAVRAQQLEPALVDGAQHRLGRPHAPVGVDPLLRRGLAEPGREPRRRRHGRSPTSPRGRSPIC